MTGAGCQGEGNREEVHNNQRNKGMEGDKSLSNHQDHKEECQDLQGETGCREGRQIFQEE